jgi:hypothetical protein
MNINDEKENFPTPEELYQIDCTACFQKAETNLLIEALKKSDTERFMMATKLYKTSMMLKNATIIHQSFKAKV